MIRTLIICSAFAIAGPNAFADEPMTRDAVVEAAREGVDFVNNSYIQDRKIKNPDLVLIDVRTKSEYDLGRIPGAIWIPRGRAEFEIAEKYATQTPRSLSIAKPEVEQRSWQKRSTHRDILMWSPMKGLRAGRRRDSLWKTAWAC